MFIENRIPFLILPQKTSGANQIKASDKPGRCYPGDTQCCLDSEIPKGFIYCSGKQIHLGRLSFNPLYLGLSPPLMSSYLNLCVWEFVGA